MSASTKLLKKDGLHAALITTVSSIYLTVLALMALNEVNKLMNKKEQK